jgi:hypothetical protein
MIAFHLPLAIQNLFTMGLIILNLKEIKPSIETIMTSVMAEMIPVLNNLVIGQYEDIKIAMFNKKIEL